MDNPRKIAIGIVMIVPTFVGAGAIYDGSSADWAGILVWVATMAVLYGSLITGKFSLGRESE